MNLSVKKALCFLQKLSPKHCSSCCSIANFTFLRLCNLNHHLCSRMVYLHFFKNCHPIICYSYVPSCINKHLVHSSWSKCSFYNIRNNLRSKNVVSLCISSKYS